MLSAGKEKLKDAPKQLADIKLKKETICKKLCKQERTVKEADCDCTTSKELESCTEWTLLWVHKLKWLQGVDAPVHVSLRLDLGVTWDF